MDDLCFIDCETTGLEPDHHVVWEIGFIIDDIKHCCMLELTDEEIRLASSQALSVGNFYSRYYSTKEWFTKDMVNINKNLEIHGWVPIQSRRSFALWLVQSINTRHLAGMNPNFDDEFIGNFCRKYSIPPVWNYHLVDIEALIAGKQKTPPPWKSKDLSLSIGIDPDDFDRHTALGDAEWAMNCYKAVMDG